MFKSCNNCEFEKRCVPMGRCILRAETSVEAKKPVSKKIKKSIFGKKK